MTDIQTETSLATRDARDALDAIDDFEIRTPDQLELAREVIREIKGKWRELEDRRKDITAPLNASLKSVNDLFRPALSYYATCEQRLKGKLAAAIARFEAEQRAALERVNALSAAGQTDEARDALLNLPEAQGAPAGVSVRAILDFELEDESLVPREYLSVDAAKVKRALQEGVRHIPGIRVYERSSVTVRSK